MKIYNYHYYLHALFFKLKFKTEIIYTDFINILYNQLYIHFLFLEPVFVYNWFETESHLEPVYQSHLEPVIPITGFHYIFQLKPVIPITGSN
jgi:hypothetical protein